MNEETEPSEGGGVYGGGGGGAAAEGMAQRASRHRRLPALFVLATLLVPLGSPPAALRGAATAHQPACARNSLGLASHTDTS